jgi:hypothetical protein
MRINYPAVLVASNPALDPGCSLVRRVLQQVYRINGLDAGATSGH